MSRVAVVTGSNQGIGFAIVRALCKQFDGATYLTARNVEAGLQAIEELKKEDCNPHFRHLDINDKISIGKFKAYLQNTYGGLDILVNNAAVHIRAEKTLHTNYWSTLDVCDQLFPILRSYAGFVNVASTLGTITLDKCSAERKHQILACTTVDQSSAQLAEYTQRAKAGTDEVHGWPSADGYRVYGVSKTGLIMLSKIQQANIDKDTIRQDIVINSCYLGYVATKMTEYQGYITADEEESFGLVYIISKPLVDISASSGCSDE